MRIEVRPSTEPGSRFWQLTNPAGKPGDQTASEKSPIGQASDKPDFGALANAISLEPTVKLIAWDSELVLSERRLASENYAFQRHRLGDTRTPAERLNPSASSTYSCSCLRNQFISAQRRC